MVAVAVGNNLLNAVTSVSRRDLSELLLHGDNQVRVDTDFSGATAGAAKGLVHQHAGMWGDVTLAFGARREQELTHGGSHTGGHSYHVGLYILHGVVDGHAGSY